jgi:hypothetical protein
MLWTALAAASLVDLERSVRWAVEADSTDKLAGMPERPRVLSGIQRGRPVPPG